jgi:hypothetical protein
VSVKEGELPRAPPVWAVLPSSECLERAEVAPVAPVVPCACPGPVPCTAWEEDGPPGCCVLSLRLLALLAVWTGIPLGGGRVRTVTDLARPLTTAAGAGAGAGTADASLLPLLPFSFSLPLPPMAVLSALPTVACALVNAASACWKSGMESAGAACRIGLGCCGFPPVALRALRYSTTRS